MSKLTIKKMGLFATPTSQQDITDWIEKFPAEQRIALLTVMGMTWNFLAQAVDDHNTYGGDAVSTGDE